MEILYKPTFIREFNKLNKDLQEEALEKLELLKTSSNHKSLKVHKLKGKLSSFYSFSVNYNYRIVFQYRTKKEVYLFNIGDHDIYK